MTADVFWAAFGAIGTSVGSLVMAITVIVAYQQYRQPLMKKLRIRFSATYPINHDNTPGKEIYTIHVSNTGTRDVNVTGIMLNYKHKDLLIYDAQVESFPKIGIPTMLAPEATIEMRIDKGKLARDIAYAIQNKVFPPSAKLDILVTDSSGRIYLHKTKWRINDFSNVR